MWGLGESYLSWCKISLYIPDSQDLQGCHHSLPAEFFPVPVPPHRMAYPVYSLLVSIMRVTSYIVEVKRKLCIYNPPSPWVKTYWPIKQRAHPYSQHSMKQLGVSLLPPGWDAITGLLPSIGFAGTHFIKIHPGEKMIRHQESNKTVLLKNTSQFPQLEINCRPLYPIHVPLLPQASEEY